MSVTKNPQAKAPMSRNTKAIQSSVFCGRTYLPSTRSSLRNERNRGYQKRQAMSAKRTQREKVLVIRPPEHPLFNGVAREQNISEVHIHDPA